MAKETGTLDLKALKIGHGDASTKATNYIEADSSGIKVHKQGDSNTYVQIVSGAINFVRSGVSAMKLWVDNQAAKVRIGVEAAGHAIFSPDGMEIFDYDSTLSTPAAVSIAKFGKSETRVGTSDGKHVDINSDGMVVKSNTTEIAKIGSSGFHFGKADAYSSNYFSVDSSGNGLFQGAKLTIRESPYDPAAGSCVIKPHYIKVQHIKKSSSNSISLYAASSDEKIGLYDENQQQWILYSLYFSGDPYTPENNTLYMSLPCKFNNHLFLANGTEIWDNTRGVTHLLTPTNSSNKRAEFTFEPDGKIYRRTSTNGGSSWTSWTSIAG